MNKIMNKAKEDNKGFSLVELIIVIAIMAILIGVVALQVVPYLEKSRVGKDRQLVDSVYSAFQTGVASTEGITADVTITITDTSVTPAYNASPSTDAEKILNEMIPVLGADTTSGSGNEIFDVTVGKLSSADAKSAKQIDCKYTYATKKIEVSVPGTDIKSSNK